MEIIFGCVHALLVAANAAQWSIISGLQQRCAATELRIATMRDRLAKLATIADRTSTARLSAELDDLRGALDSVRDTHRRFADKVWGRVQWREKDKPPENETPEQTRARLRQDHGVGTMVPGNGAAGGE
jgi:hypothetical protein